MDRWLIVTDFVAKPGLENVMRVVELMGEARVVKAASMVDFAGNGGSMSSSLGFAFRPGSRVGLQNLWNAELRPFFFIANGYLAED